MGGGYMCGSLSAGGRRCGAVDLSNRPLCACSMIRLGGSDPIGALAANGALPYGGDACRRALSIQRSDRRRPAGQNARWRRRSRSARAGKRRDRESGAAHSGSRYWTSPSGSLVMTTHGRRRPSNSDGEAPPAAPSTGTGPARLPVTGCAPWIAASAEASSLSSCNRASSSTPRRRHGRRDSSDPRAPCPS